MLSRVDRRSCLPLFAQGYQLRHIHALCGLTLDLQPLSEAHYIHRLHLCVHIYSQHAILKSTASTVCTVCADTVSMPF